MAKEKYKIVTINSRDYVSLADAKKILGVSSVAELRSLRCQASISINNEKPLWSLSMITDRADEYYGKVSSFAPDMEWIEAYKKRRIAGDNRPRKRLSPKRSTKTRALTSSARLKDLVQLMPPPSDVRGSIFDWAPFEDILGFEYPRSYKDFVEVYGGLEWFDWLLPIVPHDKTPERFVKYLKSLAGEIFGSEPVNEKGELLLVPEFGEPGFWLPFMTGSDGDSYAWLVDGSHEKWCVLREIDRRVEVIPPISIVEMFVGWLKNEPFMQKVWGSVVEFREHSPERINMLL